ncbi:BlaI/MecI/CopY family transcriptional regulator [Tautonia plasticadhaerens]|uniref:Penicillinase repressor n=1 Tax=Tautonia plasticadhaerens TaxID=2527974 RepID=A0A518H0P1_9BACT|nr:BlaI/MecI/CopY family transcriptional regulator [Tautonia plasticadhaerens]QDV34409.1 Penicillinase repressor [Tautonia plasticadhaerens]
MANRPNLSDAELEVLKALWDHGPATVRQINSTLQGRGRRWAYTTVATLLQRLQAKRAVAVDPSAVPHVYRAALTRDDLLGERLKAAADELCDGRAAPLVLTLVQSHRFSPEELARFRQLIDEQRGRSRPAKRPGQSGG